MKTSKKLSVIIPIYNESGIIDLLYERLVNSVTKITNDYEFIFVNDCSKDDSIQKIFAIAAKDEKVHYLSFSRNFGHQIAVTAGLNHVSGDCTVIIDGDLQDPPELIPELYLKYQEGFDVVYAKREQRKGETILKKLTSKIFYRILRKLTSFEIPLDTGDFRLIDKKVVQALKSMPEQNKFLRGQIAWLGFKQTHVLFNRDERQYGKSGYSYSKMFQLAIDAVTSFSDKPLALVSRLGFIISVFSFFIILYTIFAHFVLKETVTGWSSLIISSMFIGGIQLFSIGIIGEYISRINKNVIDRPLYIIADSNIDSVNK
ncbi:glycosyltransferase family 2 protein [Tamlana sp. I1]|uniref:glycosyltransferase family 2 protein n=1 Tax=Tamlana sp. I1 TaxID=2762061 RepID=UPI00188DD3A8|nr:glycosyltransferase family 2 protein [Tamlana sp. I1]